MYDGAFTDGNGKHVTKNDRVEYRFGARRGKLLEALQDGDACVLFDDTKQAEMVKWINLCKVENEKLFY
jgi:hypothetical protein